MNNAAKTEASEYNAYEAIRAADLAIEKARRPFSADKASMLSSAALARDDAQALFNKGDYKYARLRALDSLSYSVGVFSPIYQTAADRGPAR